MTVLLSYKVPPETCVVSDGGMSFTLLPKNLEFLKYCFMLIVPVVV